MKIYTYIFVLDVFLSMNANSATYYVSTTGNDANQGSSSSPWRNPERCAKSPVKAGDTCLVRSGTYTDTDLNGITVYIRGSAPTGTASLPITIKSEKPLAATIMVPSSINGSNVAFYVSRPYYKIEGFNITGGTKNLGSNTSYAGIVFNDYFANGGVARNNSIHHIGRTVCSNSSFGFSGMFVSYGATNILVENNKFYGIGRLRNGESGCKTDKFNHDHGIYIKGTNNLIARRNLFYDTNRGYPIHVFGGTATNLNIYHNTISGKSPTGLPAGQIMLGSTIKGAVIKNNISHDASYGMVNFYNLTAASVAVSYNVSSNSDRNELAALPAGVTFSNNLKKVSNIGFVNWSARNYLLLSTSAARNRGSAIGVLTVPDGKPDMGAFEY